MRPTVTFKAPKILNIPGTLMTMLGKMETDEEKNRVTLTYNIKVRCLESEPRDYRITATHSLDFTKAHNGWNVEATADLNRRLKHRFTPEACGCHNINTKLEEALNEATEWIGKKITEHALYNMSMEDMNWHLL